MIKRRFAIAITVFIMLAGVFALTACEDEKYEKHTHTYGEWSADTATCTAGGAQKRACTKCGYTETRLTSSLGHDEVSHAAKAPSCALPGWSEYVTCTRCAHTTYKEIPALHDIGELIAEIPATCEKDGQLEHYYCAECDKYYSADKKELSEIKVTATGHKLVGGVCTQCASKGLSYRSVMDGAAYAVYGIGSCTDSSIVIPAVYQGKPVCAIDARAFENYTALVSITVPESITDIGSAAFAGCYNLAEVINKSALEIKKGDNALGGIAAYAIEVHNGDSGIARLDNYFFYTSKSGASYLIRYIGDSETLLLPLDYHGEEYSVADYAFYGKALKSVVISDGVLGIGKYAFGGCKRLAEITVGKSVAAVGTGAFDKCDSLKSVYVKDIAAWCNIAAEDEDNPIFSAANKLYLDSKLVTELVIPEGVEKINNYAFSSFADIKSAVIPDSVKSIGKYAFSACTGLVSLEIGTGLEYIGESAFASCTSLTAVSLPAALQYVGDDAFYYCNALESVNIEDLGAWCGIEFGNYASNPIRYSEELSLGGELLTEAIIPNGVTEISDYAFYYCKSITDIKLPDSINKIGYQAFYECDGISLLDVPASVVEISDYAFYNCTRLEKLIFSDSSLLKSIGESAFKYCTALSEIALPESTEQLGNSAFASCTLLESAVIPSGVKSLGNYLFSDCISLKSLILDSSVESVGAYALYGCTALSELKLGSSLKAIGEYAFYDCAALESIVIPSLVESIGAYAFGYCTSVSTLVIPDSVKTLGDKAFVGCEGLRKVTMPTSAISYIPKGNLHTAVITSGKKIEATAFTDVATLVSITLPSTLEAIEDRAFSGCYRLVEVINKSELEIVAGASTNGAVAYNAIEVHSGESKIDILDGYVFYTADDASYLVSCISDSEKLALPESYSGSGYRIHKYAFHNIQSVKSLVIPAAASIGEYAFSNCMSLEKLYVIKGISQIPANAFIGCTALKDVYYTGTDAEWGSITIASEGNAFINNAKKHFKYKYE